MQCPTIKFHYFLFGIDLFFKYIKYFSFMAEKNEKKHIFLMNFQKKILKFQMALNVIDVYP
jgi:hypothetical protein